MGKAACGTCHFAPTFSGLVPPLYRESESEVLGVMQGPDSTRLDADPGRSRNGRPEDRLALFDRSFKTTTVRNVELTAPYFHNGAYQTLDEVIDFYDKGGARGLGASDLPNQTLAEEPLQLDEKEKQALKHFLLSLTDRCALGETSTQCNSAVMRP
jgi:cytochrome c peroxidase